MLLADVCDLVSDQGDDLVAGGASQVKSRIANIG